MLDRTLIRWLRPGLERGARVLHTWGVRADLRMVDLRLRVDVRHDHRHPARSRVARFR
jgi:hypothetical protein